MPCDANVDPWIRRLGILAPVDGVSEKVHKRGRDVLTKTDQFGHLVRRYEIDECLVALEQFRGVADRVDHVECNRCAALRSEEQTSALQSPMRNTYAVVCLQK